MRWDRQGVGAVDGGALPGLGRITGLVRSVRTPEFDGITFHEVMCKSALNKVPVTSAVPFRWTINPYRGCSHACVYCFARNSHTYLDLDAGDDFDRQVIVKVNVVEVLRRQLAKPSWSRESVAMGTNTDPYQRAEGRYQLMPGIVEALSGSGTPFSILTKGTLLRRDLPLLAAAARSVRVSVAVSLGLLDSDLHRSVEPGTPTPKARLELIRAVRAAGLSCGVMVAPILPALTDSAEHLDALVAAVLEAGATAVTPIALHLRPGAREWYLRWLTEHHPDLVPRYQKLYARGAYADRRYRDWLRERTDRLLRKHHAAQWGGRGSGPEGTALQPSQGALF